MHSFFRFNNQEIVVENVAPASNEFQRVVNDFLVKAFGEDKDICLEPYENFKEPAKTPEILSSVLLGTLESEKPMRITVTRVGDEEIISEPVSFVGFIGFRK